MCDERVPDSPKFDIIIVCKGRICTEERGRASSRPSSVRTLISSHPSPSSCVKLSLYTSGRPVFRSETRAVSLSHVFLSNLPLNTRPIGELYTLEHGLNVCDRIALSYV